MRFVFQSLLVLAIAVYCSSAQYHARNPQTSFDVKNAKVDERFLKTLLLTLTTSTTTITSTAVTTCTTSTAALSVCTASGRRRRGLHLSGNKEGRGLFYNDDNKATDEGSIFLPHAETIEPKAALSEAVPAKQEEVAPIPFVVQPGFNAPAGQARLFLTFRTSTVTLTTTRTTTSSLTAICQSTTGFQLCGSIGK